MCDVGVQEGGVTERKYLRWFKRKVLPLLNRWDPDNPAPNSVVCMCVWGWYARA